MVGLAEVPDLEHLGPARVGEGAGARGGEGTGGVSGELLRPTGEAQSTQQCSSYLCSLSTGTLKVRAVGTTSPMVSTDAAKEFSRPDA